MHGIYPSEKWQSGVHVGVIKMEKSFISALSTENFDCVQYINDRGIIFKLSSNFPVLSRGPVLSVTVTFNASSEPPNILVESQKFCTIVSITKFYFGILVIFSIFLFEEFNKKSFFFDFFVLMVYCRLPPMEI